MKTRLLSVIALLALAVGIATGSAPVSAATESAAASASLSAPGSLSVPQFDSSGGRVLDSATVTINGQMAAEGAVTNTSGAAGDFTADLGASFAINAGPYAYSVAAPSGTATSTLAPDETSLPVATSVAISDTQVFTAGDLAGFIGGGSVSFAFDPDASLAVSAGSAQGPSTTGTLSVSVEYQWHQVVITGSVSVVDEHGNTGSPAAALTAGSATVVTFTVANTSAGDVDLAAVATTSGDASVGAVSCSPTTIPAGGTSDCMVTLAGMPYGSFGAINFTATLTDPSTGANAIVETAYSASVDPFDSGLTVVKADAAGNDADSAAAAVVADPNAPTAIIITITNDGTYDLSNLNIADTLVSGTGAITDLDCSFPDSSTGLSFAGPLLPGETINCTGTIPALGLSAAHHDTVTVTGDADTADGPEAFSASDSYFAATPDPVLAVNVEKVDEHGHDADSSAAILSPSSPTQITVTVTNTGDETLTDIAVTDATVFGADMTGFTCDVPDTLAAGDSFTCTGTLPALGYSASHRNLVTVSATGADTGRPIEDTDAYNAATDEQTTTTSDPGPTTSIIVVRPLYQSCFEVWNSVGHSITRAEPGFNDILDDDNDGVACEQSTDFSAGNTVPDETIVVTETIAAEHTGGEEVGSQLVPWVVLVGLGGLLVLMPVLRMRKKRPTPQA